MEAGRWRTHQRGGRIQWRNPPPIQWRNPRPLACDNFLPDSLEDLLQLFLVLQKERAAIYKAFEDGFRLYLDGKGVEHMDLVQCIAAQLSSCSSRVDRVEAALRERPHGRPNLADIICGVQDHKKEKLSRTLFLQLLRISGPPSERSSSQLPGDDAHHACKGGKGKARRSRACSQCVKEEEEAEAEAEYEALYMGSFHTLQLAAVGIYNAHNDIRGALLELSYGCDG